MKVLLVDSMPCGTKIQIEDWNGEYDFIPKASTLAAYPISQVNIEGQFAPKRNKSFRASFNFENEVEAKQAFNDLKNGVKQLLDYKEVINDPRKLECL